jgi:hypothetical protein
MAQVSIDTLILDAQNHVAGVLNQLRAELNRLAVENEKLRNDALPEQDDFK